MKTVLCFGDSITEGKPGVTYVKYMASDLNCRNLGLGGDTLIGMTRRLLMTSKQSDFEDVTDIVVGIGANDIIQDFLQDYSRLWNLRVKTLIMRGSIRTVDEIQFKQYYIKLIKLLKSFNKNIVIFSIPYIETNQKLIEERIVIYNKIIEQLCEEYNISFVNYWKWQKQQKIEANSDTGTFMSKNPLLVGVDTVLTTYLPYNKHISKRRGLVLTVDGCHLNEFAAKGLASLIEKEIKK